MKEEGKRRVLSDTNDLILKQNKERKQNLSTQKKDTLMLENTEQLVAQSYQIQQMVA